MGTRGSAGDTGLCWGHGALLGTRGSAPPVPTARLVPAFGQSRGLWAPASAGCGHQPRRAAGSPSDQGEPARCPIPCAQLQRAPRAVRAAPALSKQDWCLSPGRARRGGWRRSLCVTRRHAMLVQTTCRWVQSPAQPVGLVQWVLARHPLHRAGPCVCGGSLSWRKVMGRPSPASPEPLALVGATQPAAARQRSPSHG